MPAALIRSRRTMMHPRLQPSQSTSIRSTENETRDIVLNPGTRASSARFLLFLDHLDLCWKLWSEQEVPLCNGLDMDPSVTRAQRISFPKSRADECFPKKLHLACTAQTPCPPSDLHAERGQIVPTARLLVYPFPRSFFPLPVPSFAPSAALHTISSLEIWSSNDPSSLSLSRSDETKTRPESRLGQQTTRK